MKESTNPLSSIKSPLTMLGVNCYHLFEDFLVLIKYIIPITANIPDIIVIKSVEWLLLDNIIEVGPSAPPIIPIELASLMDFVLTLNLLDKNHFNNSLDNIPRKAIMAKTTVRTVIILVDFFSFILFFLL